ncbi:hypothetical protein [Caenispirillum bisanense]|uniref:Uncharacterized protein n=1 Tax=Caenispirillum bisanense TaxID=414052 RepID=A0A286H1H9_9PROT|nr:hypothetical protein [Caenispirillum bisanense]SOE01164.1 hypothetical protein SAMN05421508_11652 [Caenispirillum bisanense]
MIPIASPGGLTLAAVKQLFGGAQRTPGLVGTAKAPGPDPMDTAAKRVKAAEPQPAPHTTAARMRDDGSASATDRAMRTGESLGVMTGLADAALAILDGRAGPSTTSLKNAVDKADPESIDRKEHRESVASLLLETMLGHLERALGKPAEIETTAEGYRRVAAFEVTRELKDGPAETDGVSMTFTGGGGRESRYSITDNRSGSTWTYRYEPRFDESQEPRGVLVDASA